MIKAASHGKKTTDAIKQDSEPFIKAMFAVDKEICPECWSNLEVYKENDEITFRCPRCKFTTVVSWGLYTEIKTGLEELYKEIERENK